jgi:hypothetical protein
LCTMHKISTGLPGFGTSAAWTYKPIWPSQSLYIVNAVIFALESIYELLECFGVIFLRHRQSPPRYSSNGRRYTLIFYLSKGNTHLVLI